MEENYQKWVEALKVYFEKQKKLWFKTSVSPHQKTVQKLQTEHFARFLEKGWPLEKDPFWKFTNINRILKNVWTEALLPSVAVNKNNSFSETRQLSEKNIDRFTNKNKGAFRSTKKNIAEKVLPEENIKPKKLFFFPDAYKIHFHNGVLQEGSLDALAPGIQFCPWNTLTADFPAWPWVTQTLNTLKKERDGFYHLSGAFPLNGYVLFVSPPSHLLQNNRAVLHVHFSFDESAFLHPAGLNFKNFLFLKENAKVTLIQTVSVQNHPSRLINKGNQPIDSKVFLINATTDVQVSEGADLRWLCIEEGTPHSCYLNQVHCDIEKSGRMNKLNVSLSSLFSRETVDIRHKGEKAHSTLLSLALLKEKAIKDQRFYIHHSKKQGHSRQFYRGILNDQSKSIFHGKIHVSAESAQTDCDQSAKNLLLSSKADSYTQPELEIHCGDVKAQHGATAGQLNKEELFYLQSRGLTQKKALEFLMMAYIKDVLNPFPDKTLIAHLIKKIQENKPLYLNLHEVAD